METLKLGTRRSLLAWAQSSWVAREIERLNPGTKVELVGIDTRGDKIVDVSLRNVVGKEFFVAELDDALREGRVDLTVHSMKDLSLDRPTGFTLAAIPRRENPRDVILFGPGVTDKLVKGQTLKIGTSSPRRIENIPAFLEKGLPHLGGHKPRVELVEIRGNVNTRLSRVHEPAGSDRALDGVVLAFAGLIRLWADGAGRAELTKLLQGVRWIVMPLRENPTAPAQGALAIECRDPKGGSEKGGNGKDARVHAAIHKLHDAVTATRVDSERQILADWGGGCHQKFGATAVQAPGSGPLLYIRGRKPDGEFVDELRWKAPRREGAAAQGWDGKSARTNSGEEKPIAGALDGADWSAPLFVAHSRALPDADAPKARASRVWTSGTPSWFRLAAQGVWVEGCAEGLGFDALKETLAQGVLGLPEFGSRWTVLTHDSAREDWGGARVIPTYEVYPSAPSDSLAREIAAAKHVYWSSGSQFDQYGKFAAAGTRHYCGPGKTAEHLRSKGIEPAVFPSAEEWKKWLST